jgi:hypothetical protein
MFPDSHRVLPSSSLLSFSLSGSFDIDALAPKFFDLAPRFGDARHEFSLAQS